MYYMQVGKSAVPMEQYRSGHNGHDWKSCVPQKGTEGSNPSCSARIKNLIQSDEVLFILSYWWTMFEDLTHTDEVLCYCVTKTPG